MKCEVMKSAIHQRLSEPHQLRSIAVTHEIVGAANSCCTVTPDSGWSVL